MSIICFYYNLNFLISQSNILKFLRCLYRAAIIRTFAYLFSYHSSKYSFRVPRKLLSKAFLTTLISLNTVIQTEKKPLGNVFYTLSRIFLCLHLFRIIQNYQLPRLKRLDDKRRMCGADKLYLRKKRL